jgi:hypothetical protein
MDDVVKHTALRLKVHNVPGTVIHHLALLKRSLDQKGTKTVMVKGWCVIEQTKEACEHYWLRDIETGLDMDLGFAVAKLRTPELAALHPVLLENLPQGLTRSDSAETLILAENSRLFDLFQENPKAFWRETPRDVASFHMK